MIRRGEANEAMSKHTPKVLAADAASTHRFSAVFRKGGRDVAFEFDAALSPADQWPQRGTDLQRQMEAAGWLMIERSIRTLEAVAMDEELAQIYGDMSGMPLEAAIDHICRVAAERRDAGEPNP